MDHFIMVMVQYLSIDQFSTTSGCMVSIVIGKWLVREIQDWFRK